MIQSKLGHSASPCGDATRQRAARVFCFIFVQMVSAIWVGVAEAQEAADVCMLLPLNAADCVCVCGESPMLKPGRFELDLCHQHTAELSASRCLFNVLHCKRMLCNSFVSGSDSDTISK